jgi:hypothetical protein
MNRRHFLTLAAAVPLSARALPFDRELISRLSLDDKPRSLSIRQGADVWVGYDLERATVCKVWKAPAGKPGLIKAGFVTRSAGTTWFEDATDTSWELRRGDKTQALKVRYLGCSQQQDHLELRWELQHDDGVLQLHESILFAAAPAAERATREVRMAGLAEGETLLLPSAARKAWKLSTAGLSGTTTHRLTLP